MSRGQPIDWDNTCSGNTASGSGRNWLRHGLKTQAALIDKLILEAKYTADQIADELANQFRHSSSRTTPRQWIDRVAEHVAHLECENNGGGDPHNLIVKENSASGVLSFDCSSKPTPCAPLPPSTRDRRQFLHS